MTKGDQMSQDREQYGQAVSKQSHDDQIAELDAMLMLRTAQRDRARKGEGYAGDIIAAARKQVGASDTEALSSAIERFGHQPISGEEVDDLHCAREKIERLEGERDALQRAFRADNATEKVDRWLDRTRQAFGDEIDAIREAVSAYPAEGTVDAVERMLKDFRRDRDHVARLQREKTDRYLAICRALKVPQSTENPKWADLIRQVAQWDRDEASLDDLKGLARGRKAEIGRIREAVGAKHGESAIDAVQRVWEEIQKERHQSVGEIEELECEAERLGQELEKAQARHRLVSCGATEVGRCQRDGGVCDACSQMALVNVSRADWEACRDERDALRADMKRISQEKQPTELDSAMETIKRLGRA